MKNFRFIILLILVLISVYFIVTVSISTKSGLIISSVKEDSECKNLRTGDLVTQVNGYQVRSVEDFEKIITDVRAGEYIPMVVNSGPGGCVAAKDGYLGIIFENVKKSGLEFSIDLQGGYITQFKPIENTKLKTLEKIVNIFKNRIKSLGIIDTEVELSDNNINIISRESGEFVYLTKMCKFVGIIDKKINIKNETVNFNLGNKTYKTEILDENNIKIENQIYSLNQSFSLDNIEFIFKNISSDYIEFSGTILTNKDVSKYQTFSGLNFDPNLKIYYITVPLLLSNDASERFVRLTEKMDTTFSGSEIVLVSPFKLFIDDDLITQLNIPRNVAGKELKSLSLLISDKNNVEVLNKRTIVDLCLGSDQLPIKVEKFNVVKLEPSSTNQIYILIFSSLIITTIIIAISLYYKTNIKSLIFGIFLSVVEIIIIFGLISLSQQFSRYIWLIDIPTSIGIAVVFITNLFKMFFLRYKKFTSEIQLNKINLLLKNLVGKLEIIFFIIGFAILFTVWKGFGLSIISGVVLWFLFIKSLYDSGFKQS